jgi:cyclopropane-fatty-acyl-phospholipid synthase
MWEFYLQLGEAGFRWSGMTVFQMQLAKDINAVPITRDYMRREEERLRRAEMAEDDRPGDQPWTPPEPVPLPDEIRARRAQ